MASEDTESPPEHESNEEWRALKALIEAKVALEPSPIELGGQSLVWYRVANPDTLLELAVSETGIPAEEIDPFWAATWRAAIGLDRFLERLPLNNLPILELGCGSGQAGIGAAWRGAVVTMTDAVELALSVARLNGWTVRERIRWQQLKWGVDQLPPPRFPVIIGSDLVYDTKLFPALERCAKSHLAPNGKLLLSEQHRHTGDHFAEWIVGAGWKTQEHDVDLNDNRIPIRVFECWLD